MSKDLTIPIEDEQHAKTILEHSRHAGSTPAARLPSKTDASVERSVEFGGGGSSDASKQLHSGGLPSSPSFEEKIIRIEEWQSSQKNGEVENYDDGRRESASPQADELKSAGKSGRPSSVEAEPTVVASESGHWYLPDGTPFYTTERRSGPRNRLTSVCESK